MNTNNEKPCNHSINDETCVLSGQTENLEKGDQPDNFVIVSTQKWYDMKCEVCEARWTEFTEPEPYAV